MVDESKSPQVDIHVDLLAIHDGFLVQLQKLADIMRLAFSSLGTVTEAGYENFSFFMTYDPAANRKLNFASAKTEMESWIVRSLVRDAVDFTSVLLDNCRTASAFFRLKTKTAITKEEVERIPLQEKDEFNRLPIPEKLARLSSHYGVSSELQSHFLSINRVRNCLVHRLGIVGRQDLDESQSLILRLRTNRFVALSPDGKAKVTIDKPGPIEPGWQPGWETADVERVFKLDDKIKLTHGEMYDTITTLAVFGNTLITSIDKYATSVGVRNQHAAPEGRSEALDQSPSGQVE